jgi:hypothetical protein
MFDWITKLNVPGPVIDKLYVFVLPLVLCSPSQVVLGVLFTVYVPTLIDPTLAPPVGFNCEDIFGKIVETLGLPKSFVLPVRLSEIIIWKFNVSVAARDGETEIVTFISLKLELVVVIGVGVD